MTKPVDVRAVRENDRAWVRQMVKERWGSEAVVAHGTLYRPDALPGFVAQSDGAVVGLVTYHVDRDACEIVSLDSLYPNRGIGTALVNAVTTQARRQGCRRLWLITTNDNVNALRFYQKRGFTLVTIHRNALEASRRLKPEIPLIGEHGIPLRDEIELEMVL